MYGRETKSSGRKTNQIAPTPTTTAPKAQSTSRGDTDAQAAIWYPWVLIAAVALYFVWAVLEQHQKIRTALEPKAIGINLRNLLVIMVTVVLGLNLFKVGAVKLSVFVAYITGGRIRLRWLVYLAGGA